MNNIEVKIKKWLGIEKAEFVIDKPFAVFQAENGAGKSSVRDAMLFMLGAQVRLTKGKDRKRLGRDGEKFRLDMSIGNAGLVGTASNVPTIEEVSQLLKVSRKALEYCTDPFSFLSAKPADLKALFSEVLRLDMDWKKAIVERGCNVDLVETLLPDMKKALKKATEMRALSKAADPVKPEDPEVELKGGKVKASQVPMDKLDQAIAQMRKKHTDLVGQNSVFLDRSLSKAAINDIKGKVADLQQKLDDAPDRDEVNKRLLNAKAEKAKLIAEHAEKEGRQKATVEAGKKMVALVKKVKLCDKCQKLMKSTIMQKKGAVDGIEAQLAKLVEGVADAERDEQAMQTLLIDLPDEAGLRSKIAELKEQLEGQVGPASIAKIKEEMESVHTRLQTGTKVRDTILTYKNELERYEDEVKEQARCSEAWSDWDKIAKSIPEVEKDGVAEGLEPLRKIMAAQKILDGAVEISDDLEITYDGRSIELLSKAERFIVALAPYVATLELFKFPFVIIDDGDYVVTKKLKARLQAAMQNIAKKKPVIFFQARPDDETDAIVDKVPADGSMILFGVRNNTVVRLAG